MKQRLAVIAAAAALVALALPGIATAADVQVVAGRVIGTLGTLMVATQNNMTLYTFEKDVKGSGVSVCTGGCLTAWPALTVAAGDTPTGGAGVTGTLGTITRSDNGAIQVTYDGLPLYFFQDDAAPGDTNGIYTNWSAVVLAAAAPPAATPIAATPPPTSTAIQDAGHPNGDGPLVPFLIAGVAILAFLGAFRRLAGARA